MSIERSLIEHCSPTLASLKVGSLFSFLAPANQDLHEQVLRANATLGQKGLTLLVMKSMGDRALCYLFRASQLEATLANEDNAAFLRENGYDDLSVSGALKTLREEGEFEPMFEGCKNALSGKKIALFGSYGWGDGEWMRTWEADCIASGAVMACDFVICQDEPDADALAACAAMGEALK